MIHNTKGRGKGYTISFSARKPLCLSLFSLSPSLLVSSSVQSTIS